MVILLVLLVFAVRGGQSSDANDQEAKNDELMKPYKFGYEIQDEKGNVQHRHEQSDGKMQTGSYGYLDAQGIYRKVFYIADKDGFRARLDSNEPGVQLDQSSSKRKIVEDSMKQSDNSSAPAKSIEDNHIDVGKSSNRIYTNLPTSSASLNDTKSWVESDLSRIKSEEPVFTNEKIYMQLIPDTKLELEHKKNQVADLRPNTSDATGSWETNQVFADSLKTANSRSYPFRYQNPPKNRKYEPFIAASNNKRPDGAANYLDNEAVVNNYEKQKKIYYPANSPPLKHQLDDVRQSAHQVHNKPLYSLNSKNGLNNNSPANHTTNRSNEQNTENYKQPTKSEYEKVRTSLNAHLSNTPQDQNNASNRPREFYVKPMNTFYETDPDPPVVQYNPPPPVHQKPAGVSSNLVQSEPVYIKNKSIRKKNKIPLYNLDQSQDAYTVKPKPYYSNKPTYPPYEYHFHMPNAANKQTYPKNEFSYNGNHRPGDVNDYRNEYAPPLPSPKPYEENSIQSSPSQSATQGRSIGNSGATGDLVKPTYLTGFSPVITEHKFSRPVQDEVYSSPPRKQSTYKSQASNKLVQPKNKYNFQMLNSGLISINELDNQIDRDKIANYPNQPYTRASNKLEQPQFVASSNDGLERINPQFENLILPENKPYTNKPNHAAATNAYPAPLNEDEYMYEKYKSMIRSRLPSKNLVYRPYDRITSAPNYAYNVTGNHINNYENELTPYNYPKSYRHNNQLYSHSSNNEPYNNSQPNDYLAYAPNSSKEQTSPLFFSKYSVPEQSPPLVNNKPSVDLEDNDPDLYNPEGAVRYSIKRYLGKNLKNRLYFKPQSKLSYPTGNSGNYEVIRPNRFSNGLINAKEEQPSNRLNLIEHSLHNYATSASNPTINKFKYNLKSLLPKMDKSMQLPYGGINIEALENQKGKLQVQKILIKDTMHQQKNPREIRDLKNRDLSNRDLSHRDLWKGDQLIQLEALARQGEKQEENEVYPFESNKTKVIFTAGNRSNFTSQLRQIDQPISLQSASTTYGSRISHGGKRIEDKIPNSTYPLDESINNSTRRPYKVRKMYVNRGALQANANTLPPNRVNETADTEANGFRFIHVPASIIETKAKFNLVNGDEYKDEIYQISKKAPLDSLNAIDQESSNRIAKYENSNLIELANQQQIIKAIPLGRVALVSDSLSVEATQLSTQIITQTTAHPSTRHKSSSIAPAIVK